MKLKTFYGKWDSWGFEVALNTYSKSITIGLLHWYVIFEIWTKAELRAADNHKSELNAWLKEMEKIQEKADKKPAKKAAKKPVKKVAKKPVKKAVKKAIKKK